MTKTIKDEVIKTLENTRGVTDIDFITDNELKVVISNRNTDLITGVEKAYIDLKLAGMVNGYRESDFGKEVFMILNKQICENPKFTDEEKAYFGLDVLEYAFYKKELEGADLKTVMEITLNPTIILNVIKNEIHKNFDNYITTFNILFTIESLLKNYYYYNGTCDLFTTYTTEFFKKENENVDEYLKYADKIVKDTTDKDGNIKDKEKANLTLVTLTIALAKVLRENNTSIFKEFAYLFNVI